MCMVYAGAHVSGANYNPAVSLSLLLTHHLTVGKTAMYIVVQVLLSIFTSNRCIHTFDLIFCDIKQPYFVVFKPPRPLILRPVSSEVTITVRSLALKPTLYST